jgi:hypothetical protein
MILWRIDPLLGNDRETNEATTVARQRNEWKKWEYCWRRRFLCDPISNWTATEERCFLCDRAEMLYSGQSVSAVQCSAVQRSEVLVGESVSELQFGLCGLLLLGAGGSGVIRGPGWGGVRRWGRCHAPTCGNILDWEDLVRAVVNCWVRQLAIAL